MSARWNIKTRCKTLLAFAGVSAALLAYAPRVPAELMAEYVSPSILEPVTNHAAPAKASALPAQLSRQSVASGRSGLTPGQRWERFETQFGIQRKNPSAVLGAVQSAKYTLDQTAFAAQEFVESFRYEAYLKELAGGSSTPAPPRRFYRDPLTDSLENAKIKSGVDWDKTTGQAFVGVRLVLPIGD